MTSATIEFRSTIPDHPVRRTLLIAMLVYSLGFVGAAAIVWHGSQRVRPSRLHSYAASSHGRIAGVFGCRVGTGCRAVAGSIAYVHCRMRMAR